MNSRESRTTIRKSKRMKIRRIKIRGKLCLRSPTGSGRNARLRKPGTRKSSTRWRIADRRWKNKKSGWLGGRWLWR